MELNIEEKVFMVAASARTRIWNCQELALNRATVCIASRTKDEVESAAENLRKEQGQPFSHRFDASDQDQSLNGLMKQQMLLSALTG